MECQDIHSMLSGGCSMCKEKVKKVKSVRDYVSKGKYEFSFYRDYQVW